MDLERLLTLNNSFKQEVQNVCTSGDLQSVSTKISKAIEAIKGPLTKILNSKNRNNTYEGDHWYKELYAHNKCHIAAEGLLQIFNQLNINAESIVMLDVNGKPLHYLIAIEINGNQYYCDAYGFFCNVETIKSRYVNDNIHTISKFNPDDECEASEIYRDTLCLVYDEVADHITDSDIELEIEYSDLFCKTVGMKMINNIINTHSTPAAQ